MRYLQTVGTEGGPILLADPHALARWRGAGEDGEGADYVGACEALGDDEAASWDLDGSAGLIWSVEGGTVLDVGVDADRRTLVVVQSWLSGTDGDGDLARVYAGVADANDAVETNTGLVVPLPRGVAAVLWAACGFGDLVPPTSAERLATLAARDSPVELGNGGIAGLGTVVRVQPGDYAVRTGARDEGDIEYRWCRLTLAEARG